MNKEELLDIIFQAKSLQEFVDETAKLLQCPYWVMDEGFHVVAISHQPDAVTIYNEFVKNASLIDSIQRWEKYNLFSNVSHQRPERFYDDLLQKNTVIMDVMERERPIGRITFFPLHEMDDEQIENIGKGLSVYLRTSHIDQNRDTYHQAFASLLRGEDVEACANVLSNDPIKLTSPYQVICIGAKNRDLLFAYASYIQDMDEKLIPVVTGGYLYALCSRDHTIDKWKSKLPEIGRSYPFSDLRKMKSYGMQASYSFDVKKEQIILSEYVTYLLDKEVDTESLISPKVKECMKYDKSYQTQYFDTLYSYLMNAESKQATAKQMNIHLNTVKYRLNQIETLFNIEFEQDRTELFLSCLIAKK